MKLIMIKSFVITIIFSILIEMIKLAFFSFRFAEQVLNSELSIEQKITDTLTDNTINVKNLSRPELMQFLERKLERKSWESQPSVFNGSKDHG